MATIRGTAVTLHTFSDAELKDVNLAGALEGDVIIVACQGRGSELVQPDTPTLTWTEHWAVNGVTTGGTGGNHGRIQLFTAVAPASPPATETFIAYGSDGVTPQTGGSTEVYCAVAVQDADVADVIEALSDPPTTAGSTATTSIAIPSVDPATSQAYLHLGWAGFNLGSGSVDGRPLSTPTGLTQEEEGYAGDQVLGALYSRTHNSDAATSTYSVSVSADSGRAMAWSMLINPSAGGGEINQAISPATETDLPVTITNSKSAAVNTIVEVDEAQSLAAEIAQSISPAIEPDTAVSIIADKSLSISSITETDLGITVIASKSLAIAPVSDLQSAETLSTNIAEGINPAIETDLSAGALSQSKSLFTVSESDLSVFIPAPNTINQSISPAFESNDFPTISWVRSKAVNTITELSTSVNLGTEIAVPIGFAGDSNNAQSVIRVRHISLSPAFDTSSTLTLTAGHSLSIAMAVERDAAVRNPNAPILLYPMIGISTLIEFLELLTHDYPMIGSDLWHEG